MKAYHIALGVMIFSFSLNMLNDSQIFVSPLPNYNAATSEAQVTDMINASTDSTDLGSEFFEILMIVKVLKFIIGMLSSALYIIPLLSMYQVPSTISLPLQSIIWIIYGWGILSWISGRSSKNYE